MSDKKFNDETSKVIWNKLKDKDVLQNYTDNDKKTLLNDTGIKQWKANSENSRDRI
jgi:hypothetical protein